MSKMQIVIIKGIVIISSRFYVSVLFFGLQVTSLYV